MGFTFFFLCVPSHISQVHLLLHSQLYLWGSSSTFPAIFLGFTFFFFCVSSYIHGVHLLLLCSQLYLWDTPSSPAFPAIYLGFTFFFFCIPSHISHLHLLLHSHISGVHFCSSAFQAISLSFTFCVHQLHLWASPSSVFPAISLGFIFFFCVPSYVSGLHFLLLRSQLYLWASFSSSAFLAMSLGFIFFFCVPSYVSGLHFLLLRS